MTASGLQHGDVRVWTVLTDAGPDRPDRPDRPDAATDAATAALAILSPDERERALRMTDVRARGDFVIAHALVRRALTDCAAEVDPREWQFAYDENGRPHIAREDGERQHIAREDGVRQDGGSDLRFSLSHADGVVACAVAGGVDCGIDVEPVAAAGPRRRVLTPGESAALDAAGPDAAATIYARLWTLKEAYGKARGLGFLLPYDQLHVTLGATPTLEDRTRDPGRRDCYVEQWEPTARHVAALAVLAATPRVRHSDRFPP